MKKKLLAALLALVMVVSMLPLAVSAEEECIHGVYGQLGPYAADENQHYYICSNCGEISGYMAHYDGQTNTYAATDDGVIAWTGSTEGSDGVCDECGYGCQHTNTAVANYDTYCMEYCVSCGTILSTTSTDPEPTVEIVASGTCGDNVTWVLDDSGTLTISGTGAMDSSPWYDYSDQIKTAVIEDGVTSIASFAFSGYTGLSSVTIGNSVTSIGDYAFQNCTSLTSVTIPDSVTYIGWGAFQYCSALTSVTIPDGVTTIGAYAFTSCTSLTSVTIPDGVTIIYEYTFSHCTSLTSITIPASVTDIGWNAFRGCTSLTAIEVDPDNANYSSQDGVLFNKDMTTLLLCAGGKAGAYVIPAGVTAIDSFAFSGCTSLTSVTIPDSVTDIGWDVFADCTSLNTVIFEGNAPANDSWAFYGLTATAYYPAGNETWTEDVMQNYGGTITWVAYSETDPIEPDPTEPEPTEPEPTEPEPTEPEPTEPEPTEPEPTEPEPTEPEPTDPEVTEPETTEPEVTEPETTETETTEPETTEPETTDPDTGADDEAKTGDNAIVFLALALLCIALPVVKKFVF